MKNSYVKEFLLRGLTAAGFGPVVLAVIYGILGATGTIQTLTPAEACRGILSVEALAFLVGGISMIYTVERLPVATAALIHGGVLYLGYLIMYLLNSWVPRNPEGIGLFTAIFAVGYGVIWLVIYLVHRRKARQMSAKLHGR